MNISRKIVVMMSVTIGLGCLQSVAAEQIFKMTGSDGVVFYSDVAPEGTTNTEVIQVFPEPSAADSQLAQQQLTRYREEIQQRNAKQTETNRINAVGESEKKAPPPLAVNPFIGLAPFL